MITIVVEDGTQVATANSYVSVASVRTYAANRGVELAASNDAVAAMLIKATDYLEMFAGRYSGTRTTTTQALEWPRENAIVNGEEIDEDAIPRQLLNVQCALVLAMADGINVMPNTTATDFVLEATVGPITTKYAAPTSGPVLTQINALIRQLTGGFRIGVFRG